MLYSTPELNIDTADDKKFKIIEESFSLIEKNGWEEFAIEKFAVAKKYKTTEVKKFIYNK